MDGHTLGMLSYGIPALIAMLLAAIWILAWILLPFAMFGIKPLLRDLLAEMRRTNELLAQKQ